MRLTQPVWTSYGGIVRVGVVIATGLAGLLATLSGCGGGGDDGKKADEETKPSSSPSAAPSPTPTGPVLPANCNGVLTLVELDDVLGSRLLGSTSYIRGQAEPKIGRTERVNCRYGLRPGRGGQVTDVPVEVGLSMYGTNDQATQRVQSTVDSGRSNGAAPTDVNLGDVPATVLASPEETLLVLADEKFTLAVSISAKLAKGSRAEAVATALAGKILERRANQPDDE